jgi:hypothetical protein
MEPQPGLQRQRVAKGTKAGSGPAIARSFGGAAFMMRIAPAIIFLCFTGVCAAQSPAPQEDNKPLLHAHQQLLLARAMIVDQNYDSAVTPLREAGRALADFQKLDHGTLGEQAGFMRQDIIDYITHLGRDATVDRVDDWIHKIEGWKGNSKDPLQPPPPY